MHTMKKLPTIIINILFRNVKERKSDFPLSHFHDKLMNWINKIIIFSRTLIRTCSHFYFFLLNFPIVFYNWAITSIYHYKSFSDIARTIAVANNRIEPSMSLHPYFDFDVPKNITARVGQTAFIRCHVEQLGDKSVSFAEKKKHEIEFSKRGLEYRSKLDTHKRILE